MRTHFINTSKYNIYINIYSCLLVQYGTVFHETTKQKIQIFVWIKREVIRERNQYNIDPYKIMHMVQHDQ